MAKPISDKNIYKLTDGDKAIFDQTRKTGNLNLFTDWYLNSGAGTRFSPVDDKLKLEPEYEPTLLRWRQAYDRLLCEWEARRRPTEFQYNGRNYIVEPDFQDVNHPTFLYKHGFLFQDYQLDFINGPEPTKINFGGFGSGKTLMGAVYMLYLAATLPGFRGFALAPYSLQAMEVYKSILSIIDGTLYQERFFAGAPTKPFAQIIIKNDLVRQSTIEFYSIMDDPGKILTLTGDMAMVDQAEQLPDIDIITENVGSRFRGYIHGRERLGYLWYLANSADSNLWDLVDDAEFDDSIGVYNFTTYDNKYITPRQMQLIEQRVIKGSQDNKRVKLMGGRPLGGGAHFPPESIKKCRSEYLDSLMEDGINREAKLANENGGELPEGYERQYIMKVVRRVNIHEWSIPPQENADYWVFADPGWSNPPYRNSAVIIVINSKDFPKRPAELHAFSWVFGNGSPEPWMAKYIEWVNKYNAKGQNGFDATGLQSGYSMWVNAISNLYPIELKLGGDNKYKYLNHLKMMMARGMIQIPTIPGMLEQLSKYKLPDKAIRQDIVMTLCLCAGALSINLYDEDDTSDHDTIMDILVDRHQPLLESRNNRDLIMPDSKEFYNELERLRQQGNFNLKEEDYNDGGHWNWWR